MSIHIYLPGSPGQYPNYERALTAAGAVVRFGDTTGCHGLLLPGGGDICPAYYGETGDYGEAERDREEFALLQEFTAAKKPVFGICRGLQVINVFFGGTLFQDIPGHTKLGKADRLHKVTLLERSVPGVLYGRETVVNSAHHQAIKVPGEGIVPVGWAEDGTIEAICHKSLPVWGVQWHPERLTGGCRRMDRADGMAVISWFAEQC